MEGSWEVQDTKNTLESEDRKLISLLDLVLIDLHECERERLVDAGQIREGMLKAAGILGAVVIGDSFHTFKPWGVSGTVAIAESHLAVHTWPEYNFAAITIETCGNHLNHQKAYQYLIQFFRAKHPKIIQQKRGLMDLPEAGIKYKHVAC